MSFDYWPVLEVEAFSALVGAFDLKSYVQLFRELWSIVGCSLGVVIIYTMFLPTRMSSKTILAFWQ